MVKNAITILIIGMISMTCLQAQSDFGPKQHHSDPIQTSQQTSPNSQKSILAYSLPFAQEFESATFPPTDWATFIGTNGAGNSYNWTSTNNGYVGKSSFIDWDNVGAVCEDWMVSPLITLGENTSLSFYEKQDYSTNYGSNYYVKISTNSQTNHADFTNIMSYTETDFSTSWSSRTIDLSAYDGQDVYIAFVMTNDDGDSWYVDNILIDENPGGGGVTGGDLIISEVAYPVEADGSKGRFVEIYNSGDQDVDLSDYYLGFYKTANRINLSGTVSAGATFVYAPSQSDFNSCYGSNPDQSGSGINSSWFNGTDAIMLIEKVGNNYRRRDTYGVLRQDGSGTEWDYNGMHAVRSINVIDYNKNFDVSEWEISTAYYSYRDVTPGNHNVNYYWSGSYNDEWDDYRNWLISGGIQAIPDAAAHVVIPSGTTNDAASSPYNFPYYFNTLTVESGATFTLKSFNILKLKGDATINSGGNLYLESDANGAAVFIPEGTVTGDVDIQRYFPTIGGTPTNGEWHYFSPPISDLSSSVFVDQFLMYWDEPTTYWQYITDTDVTLTPGLGYGLLLQNSFGNTININGQMNTSDIQSPVLHNTSGAGWQGWNLIGNPYTATLDWEVVVNELPPQVDVGISYWDAQSNQYVVYNNGNGSATQYIPPMQGFFIHTNQDNQQFTIPANARTYTGADVFYKAGEGKPYISRTPLKRVHHNRLIVTSSNMSGKSDEAYLEFHEKATVNFDQEFDATKFHSNNDTLAEVYYIFQGIQYAINVLPDHLIDGRYDLAIKYGMNDSYTLKFDDMESFDEEQSILLYDKLTQQYYDLREVNQIQFEHSTGITENRFEIVFDNYLSSDEMTKSDWLIYSTNGCLNITPSIQADLSSHDFQYQIISIDGKTLYEASAKGSILNKRLPFSQGMYIVKFINHDQQKTKKLWLSPR